MPVSENSPTLPIFPLSQFAKNIPKPEPAKAQLPAAAGDSKEQGKDKDSPAEGAAVPSQLEILEQQHMESQARVERIRAELARLL